MLNLLLYAGPDQLLPLASVIGGLIGVLLLWWNRIAGFVARTRRSLLRRTEAGSTATKTTVNRWDS
jgi:hypothetical protein